MARPARQVQLDPPASRLRPEDVRRTIWLTRPDLRRLVADDPERFQVWLAVYGVQEYQALREAPPEVPEGWLSDPAPGLADATGEGGLPVTRFMHALWLLRPDLQQAFDLDQAAGRRGLVQWYLNHGVPELGLERFLTPPQRRLRGRGMSQASWRRGLQGARARLDAWRAPRTRPRTDPAPFGLNLVGYARGQLGIGEDLRMAARACEAAGIPHAVVNVEPGREVCQGDHSLEDRLARELPYAATLFCATGMETARIAAVEGRRLFGARRCIGAWPWELPRWPAEWQHAFHLVDEIWAGSRYQQAAYAAAGAVPVRHMPMAVTVDATAGRTRSDFGLPADRFLFVYAFDLLSGLARKNPEGCIEAFRRAFPRGDEPAGLVLKAMRAEADPEAWRALHERAAADPRIRLLEGTLARGELLDLYRACDCYLSLHRSEGFGRGMAEAMLLGRPVVCTGYSGNLDFATPETAALVRHGLRPVAGNEYPWGTGQEWAEPDLDDAAGWLRRMAEEEALRARLAEAGRRRLEEICAPTAVGRRYREALEAPQGSR